MARLPRLGVAGWPHLLIQQVHDGQLLARDDTDRQDLLDALREAARQHGVAVHAYQIGTSALVLLVTPERADSTSLFMQAVGRRYVANHNRRHGRQGGLWSGRFRGTVLEPARYLLDAMAFTETRDAGPDALPGGTVWSDWSSAPHHLGLRTDPLVTDAPGFWALGNTPFERQAAWRQRLQEGLGASQRRELAEAMHKGWALMPPEQQRAMEASIGRPLSPRPRGRPRKSI
ncbi:transposase [Aquabacterium sp. UBA2148]|uniref:transposase n=1 Tax=Aquabacterium sp. UBA2148 TaxID=1946042 RepID=UPI00257FE8DB|nr:transposase [Aquabacterium sp. UBA2148]